MNKFGFSYDLDDSILIKNKKDYIHIIYPLIIHGNMFDETSFQDLLLQKPIATFQKCFFLTQEKISFNFQMNKGLYKNRENIMILLEIINDSSKKLKTIQSELIEEIILNHKDKKETINNILLKNNHEIIVEDYRKFESNLEIQLPNHLESVSNDNFIIQRKHKIKFLCNTGDPFEIEIPFHIYNPNGVDFPKEEKNEKITGENFWKMENDSGKICKGCGKKFNLFVRRHYCRGCFFLFCSSCSSNKKIIPIYGKVSPMRVCDSCFHSIN